MATTALALPENQQGTATLTPLVYPKGYVPGKYASFDVSPEPMFGPDELGEYKSAIDDLSETCTRADSSARNFEVLQAWEQRLFERNYQLLLSTRSGWGLGGGGGSPSTSGAAYLAYQDAGRHFSCNVFGARQDKIVPILSRDVPPVVFVPKRDSDPVDQTCADEAKSYLKVWLNDAGLKEVVGQIATLYYTDDRVCLYTRSVADEQEWGTQTPDEQQEAFGAPGPDGITPETELQGPEEGASPVPVPNGPPPAQPSSGIAEEVPSIREMTTAYGKLECKVPIYADRMQQMPWIRISTEQNINTLKERYPWIEDKIKAGGAGSKNGGGADQLDRQARINVRLAVQSSTSSGESWQQDATETLTWYRPSQYRAIKQKEVRQIFYENFPDGLLVVHAGGELAFIRNESMNKHLVILHPKHGSGQNRRSIGTNYLPLQKILNANINLLDKYLRACVPQRFHDAEMLDNDALANKPNSPNGSMPVKMRPGQGIQDITGVENVPQPSPVLVEFIQWLISGGPEAMDGAEPVMFGAAEEGQDQGVFQTNRLKRDAALGVYALPYSQICIGVAKAAEQAVMCAAANRVADIESNVPGQGRLTVEISKLQGNALCYPESMDIPQTMAEQEAEAAALLENSAHVGLYQAITSDPRNLPVFAKFPSLAAFEIAGVDAVEEQQGEFELLTKGTPQPNPMLAQIQQQVQQIQAQILEGATHPEAQTPEGQQAMQQLQQQEQQLAQQMQTIPPQVSSVPVAQNASQNHAIHAAITLGLMNSAEGRKLKNGTPEQQAIYQNLELHWQEHMEMSAKLTPPKQIEIKGNVTIDPTKLPPEAQAKAWQAIGLEVSPAELTGDASLQPHEVITEKEGVDANGIPVKQKISMVGKQLS